MTLLSMAPTLRCTALVVELVEPMEPRRWPPVPRVGAAKGLGEAPVEEDD